MAIPIYGMADHQVALYEKKDTEVDDSGVGVFHIFVYLLKFISNFVCLFIFFRPQNSRIHFLLGYPINFPVF